MVSSPRPMASPAARSPRSCRGPAVLALERRYGIKVQANQVDRTAFASIASLAEFVERERKDEEPPPSD